MTAWTQRFWLGGPPNPEVNIDNNLAYLESTRFFPNYDTTITVPESQIEQEYALWTGLPHDIYDGAWDGGLWQSGMGISGSRPEIAPYPQWSVMWMYTGDWRLRQMALGMADLAPAFPGQLREGDPAKRLSRADPAGSGTGLGHAVSITDRKTLVTAVFGYSYTTAADNINFVGAVNEIASGGPWSFDEAHQPAAFYPQYILTGDPWYLNEMYLWAGFTAARANGADTGDAAGRGPDGSYGGIDDQLRGAGWGIRNRAEAAFAAPDSDPEKAYFTYLTNDALARWEGSFGITGTAYDGTAIKTWGAQTGNYYTSNGGPVSGRMPSRQLGERRLPQRLGRNGQGKCQRRHLCPLGRRLHDTMEPRILALRHRADRRARLCRRPVAGPDRRQIHDRDDQQLGLPRADRHVRNPKRGQLRQYQRRLHRPAGRVLFDLAGGGGGDPGAVSDRGRLEPGRQWRRRLSCPVFRRRPDR